MLKPDDLYPLTEIAIGRDETGLEFDGDVRYCLPGGVKLERRDGVLLLALVVGGGTAEVRMCQAALDAPTCEDGVTVSNPRTLLTFEIPTGASVIEASC